MKRFLIAAFFTIGFFTAVDRASAQEISVRSHLDRTEVGVNREFTLSVVIEGAQRGNYSPELPDISRFARYLSTSTNQNIQMVNGRVDQSYSMNYRFRASQIGRFTIPAVTVEVEGKAYTTDPITLTVSERPPARTAGPNGAGEDGGLAEDDIFLETTTDRTQAFTGQPVIVEYRIFTRVNINSYTIAELPAASGFWVEEFDVSQERTETVVRDGKEYTTLVLRKVAVFPTNSGTKTLEPMNLDAEVRLRRRGGRDPFGFSGSLLGRTERVPIASEPVNIEVLPLPTDGRPDDFSGFVGNLRVTSSLDRTEVETNDALTFTVRVTGTGNLRTLPDPEIDFPSDFEVFPPEITSNTADQGDVIAGTKTYSYVLIPRSPGQPAIPAVAISYFDPARRDYRRASSRPFDIEVTGDAIGAPVAAGRGRAAIHPLREDIRFIQIADPQLRRRDGSLLGSSVFWAIVLTPLLALGGATGVRRHRNRLSGDVAYARQRRANKKARKKFQAARALLSENTRKEFYAEVGKALQGFLGDKLNIPEAGFMSDEVGKLLTERGAPTNAVRELVEILETCDRQRFAPSQANQSEMQSFLSRAENAMTSIGAALG